MKKAELIYTLIQMLKSEATDYINRHHLWRGDYDDIKNNISLIQSLEIELRNTEEKERKEREEKGS